MDQTCKLGLYGFWLDLTLIQDPKVYSRTRGRELPGNYNHVLLAELFHFQSKRWRQLAADHVELVYNKLKSFVTMLAKHITHEERISLEIRKQVNEHLATHMSEAEKELQTLVEDEQRQPITYNHYYTDNIQKARQTASRDLIDKIVKDTADDDFHGAMHISNNGIDVKRLVGALQKRVIVDMDEQACSEVRAGLDAYYKVSCHTVHGLLSLCKTRLTDCRLRGKHSSTMCASRSSSDIFFVHCQIYSHQRLWLHIPKKNLVELLLNLNKP
jgi:hypothetical protein